MTYLSAFLMIKDENPFLKEWIAFHLTQGYQKFYIYDNMSSNNVKDFLANEIKEGLVDVTLWEDIEIGRHVRAMNHCLNRTDIETTWLSLTDIDEFIYGEHERLIDFLEKNDTHDAVKFKWLGFGSNGHVSRPNSVLESYTKRGDFEDLPGGKSIVKFGKVTCMRDPHNPKHVKSHLFHNDVHINHYVTRSFQDWKEKAKKGGGNGRPRHLETFNQVQAKLSKHTDTRILKYLNETNENKSNIQKKS